MLDAHVTSSHGAFSFVLDLDEIRKGRETSDSGIVVLFSFLFVSVPCTSHSAAFRRMRYRFVSVGVLI